MAMLGFASGAVATLASVWHEVLTRPSGRRVEVFCRDGHVWLDNDSTGPLHVETSDGVQIRTCPFPNWVSALPFPDHLRETTVPQYAEANRAFLDAVAEGRPPAPSLAEALAAHRLADAVYRSASEGATLAVALLH